MRLYILIFFLCFQFLRLHSQCLIQVDTVNITHIICPNGGPVGSAQIVQANYLNYSWQNVSNGQLYNGGGGNGGTNRSDLDAGFYVITASSPYYSSCPDTLYSDTFEIRMPIVDIQSNPTQACPFDCNVEIALSLQDAIAPNLYTYSIDGLFSVPIQDPYYNMCGGSHTYEVFANGQSCGLENFGISEFAPMILSHTVVDASCGQLGSSTVNIDGVGASGLSNYCSSFPQYDAYSTIENVVLIGDNSSIINNTSSICNVYSDFTSYSADLNPGNTYNIDIDLGTCHSGGFALIDITNVYIDWNIDGDFNDLGELVAQIPPIQTPSSHSLSFTVPSNSVPGQSRMRIVMQNYDYQPNNNAGPCDNTSWFGETEDYTIQVNGSVATPVSYLWDDPFAQTTQTATNLTAGSYVVTITDANGCTATENVTIGGSSANVTATGSQTICAGDIPNGLSAISNGSGNYSWSPSSDFVNSNVQNPIFLNSITTTTIYTVTFTDSNGCIANDSITIIVNPVPVTQNISHN